MPSERRPLRSAASGRRNPVGVGTRRGSSEPVERAHTTAGGHERQRTETCVKGVTFLPLSRGAASRVGDREIPRTRRRAGGAQAPRCRREDSAFVGEAAGDGCGTPAGSERHRAAAGKPKASRCSNPPSRVRLSRHRRQPRSQQPCPTGMSAGTWWTKHSGVSGTKVERLEAARGSGPERREGIGTTLVIGVDPQATLRCGGEAPARCLLTGAQRKALGAIRVGRRDDMELASGSQP